MTARKIERLETENTELREENTKMHQQIKTLEGECDKQCQLFLIEQVRQRFDVPLYLLETSYCYEMMMKMDLTQLERFMVGRAMIFRGKKRKLEIVQQEAEKIG